MRDRSDEVVLPRWAVVAIAFMVTAPISATGTLRCDLSQYEPKDGLTATTDEDRLTVSWAGQDSATLRLVLQVDNGQPEIKELATQLPGQPSKHLAGGLRPVFQVTTGKRRISQQQLNPLQDLGVEPTPEIIESEKWKVFWDAPLNVPGVTGINPDLPRDPSEIRRDSAMYQISSCSVKTDGGRLEISMDGVQAGIFTGRLQFTVYRGANLIRQEIIAKTGQPSVAYKYRAGWKGLPIRPSSRVVWRDTSRAWQKYEFGGAANDDPVPLRARNRLALVELSGGTVAVLPPPHKFFWAREIEMNLGYVWYRKDDESSFSIGVRHADREGMYRPYGYGDELWEKRVRQSRRFAQGNFALLNAPPGTWQRMAAYFYVSSSDVQSTWKEALRFTHGDTYKPLDGYKVVVNHFHTHFGEQLADAGTIDMRPPWIPAFRALGINVAIMSDFHGDGHANDPGELRLKDQHTYFQGCRRHSDRDFLIVPGEEPNAHLGGHYNAVFPKPVYWTKVRRDGQQFVEPHSRYGTVYHAGSADDVLEMLRREDGFVWQAHPRTKGSTRYPDAVRDAPHFLSDRYLGGAFQSFPADLSQKRLCETRCFGVLDDMNNWSGPKFLIADGDTYTKFPEDDIYSHLAVNYVKMDRVPLFDEPWTPLTTTLRSGDFFVSTGEVLIPSFAVEGSGGSSRVIASVEWTFPLEFVEVVWGDGSKTGRKVVPATEYPPLSAGRFEVPFDGSGKRWVRFAAWDSAGNGAFTQPVRIESGGSRNRRGQSGDSVDE